MLSPVGTTASVRRCQPRPVGTAGGGTSPSRCEFPRALPPGTNSRAPLRFHVRIAAAAVLATLAGGCAQTEEPKEPTVLFSDPAHVAEQAGPTPESEAEASGPAERAAIAVRPPDEDGSWSYRLIVESSGQREQRRATDAEPPDPVLYSSALELEFAEFPTTGRPSGEGAAYLLRLDALYFRQQASGAPPQQVELADDRLRIIVGDKTETDLAGAQPKAGLTPRNLLRQIFGLVVYDSRGDPTSVQLRGRPRAREFLRQFPLRSSIRFSRLPRPMEELEPGQSWSAERFPPNPIGGLGLVVPVDYSLAGFEDLDGVRCAWILLKGEHTGRDVPSAAGFRFDRVRSKLSGEAWVELATSRLRRLIASDVSRAAYTIGEDNDAVTTRMRYKGRIILELIDDPGERRPTWSDGRDRFEIK